MNRFVSLLAFLLIIISTSYSQVHTIANGGWHQAAIWSNNQVPDTNTDVIIRHTVDVSGSTGCRNIKVDSSGVLFNGRLDIRGSFTNYGWFDATRNASSYDGISVRDSIINYGRMDTEVLWLTGDRDHFIRSRDTIRIADMSTTDSNHGFHTDFTDYWGTQIHTDFADKRGFFLGRTCPLGRYTQISQRNAEDIKVLRVDPSNLRASVFLKNSSVVSVCSVMDNCPPQWSLCALWWIKPPNCKS